MSEIVKRWNNRISVKNLALAERYLKAKMECGVVLESGSCKPPVSKQFIAIFKRKLAPLGFAGKPVGLSERRVRASPMPYVHDIIRGGDGDQELMFVGDVGAVQVKEAVIPSTIRIEGLDQFYRHQTSAIEPFNAARFEMRFIGTYWESGIIRRNASVADDQDIGEQIKRGAQIMDAVADDGAPFDWDSLAFTEAVNFVTGLQNLYQ